MTVTELTERTVTVAGMDIFVAESGDGPAVSCCTAADRAGAVELLPQPDVLARSFRVIVPTCPLRPLDQARRPQSDPFGYLADAIRGLLDELGIGTAHLVGNSYGGRRPRGWRSTPRARAGWCRMGPGGIGTTAPAHRRAEEPAGVLRRRGSEPRRSLATLHPYLPGVRRRHDCPDLIDLRTRHRSTRGHRQPPLQRPRPAPCGGWTSPATSGLRHLPNPTLVLWGRDDKVNRPTGGPLLLKTMPNAELVMTSHTGHWMQWERAELFNQLVADFLSRLRLATS